MNIDKTILLRKYLKNRLSTRSIVILVVTFMALSTLTYTTKVRQVKGDSALSLLVSRAIAESGSIKLNRYRHLEHYAMVETGGNYYDYFPLGTPVLSIPAVFILDKLGIYHNTAEAMTEGQIILMTLINPIIFILMFMLGRRFLPDPDAYVISLVCFLGSPLTSTLNTALLSHTYALLISLTVILQLARYATDEKWKPDPYVIGSLLFLAYFTRPMFSAFVLAALAYLMSRDRAMFLKAAGTFMGMLAAFSLFSYNEYGLALPPYYLRGMGDERFLTALYGVLLSPSRGLFIFMPFLAAVLAGALYLRREVLKDRLFLFAFGFVSLNIIFVSLSRDWSGGEGFGPRLLADSMPAWALMTFIVWMYARENTAGKQRRRAGRAWLFLGLLAVGIHSYQGLYNPWTYMWNKYPPISQDVNRIAFDWKHPQMLSTAASVRDKLLWYYGYKGHDVSVDLKSGTLTDFDLTSAEGYIRRGEHRLASGLPDKAYEDFDRAIAISPMEPEAFYYRGHIRLEDGRNEEAIDDFTTSLVYNSINVQAYMERGTAYDNTGEYALALADYMEASSLANPSDPALMGLLLKKRGIDHFRTGFYTQSVEDLRAAIGYGEGSPEVLHHIAAANYAARNYSEASNAYKKIVEQDPDDEKARLMLLNSRRKDPDIDTGAMLSELKGFVVSTPSIDPVRAISRHYLGMEALSEDDIILAAEKEGNPEELCETYYLLAEQRLTHGFTVGARSLLKKGEESCPRDIPDYYLTRSLLNWMGR